MRSSIICFLLFLSYIIYAGQIDFERADNYAISLPENYSTTTQLAHAINDSNFNDIEKIRILYTWIAHNIIYDIESFETGFRPSPLPENTLKNKMAICRGYAELFDSVCNKLGIRSYIITGYVEDGFNPSSSNHAWNVVQLENDWFFIDPTYGSGYVEKYIKQSFFSKLLKHPGIKEKSVFVSKMNDNYFLATTQEISETHVPADPMWQMNEYPQSLGCFITGSDACPNDSSYFNYYDTLRQFIYLKPEEQLISSAKRTIKFNGYNYYDLAMAYLNVGMKHYNLAESIVPEAADFLISELTLAYNNLDHGLFYLKKGWQIKDSIYRVQIATFKNNYKISDKKFKSYSKIINKSVGSNYKFLDNAADERNKLRQQIDQYSESAFVISLDEKIYLVERPVELPDYYDSFKSSEAKHRIDSIKLLLYKDMDTLNYFFTKEYKVLLDSAIYLRSAIPDIIDYLDTLNAVIRKIYIENLEETFKITDSLFYYTDSYYETLTINHNILENIVKQKMKEKNSFVKATLKSLESEVKESKTDLVEMKKLSFLERGEEEYYETLNKVIYDNYMKYIEILEKQEIFFKEGKGETKSEIKLLQKYLKDLFKTNEYLTTYYKYNYNRMKNRYINEKDTFKQYTKTASAALTACSKILGK